jgi:hypothetical protein
MLAVLLVSLAFSTAWALDLGEAKEQGLVGEARTGYLEAVQQPPSAEVKALIAEVNAKRKAQFQSTAEKTNTTLPQVANRFWELAVERTAPGHYYQDANGNWRKK